MVTRQKGRAEGPERLVPEHREGSTIAKSRNNWRVWEMGVLIAARRPMRACHDYWVQKRSIIKIL